MKRILTFTLLCLILFPTAGCTNADEVSDLAVTSEPMEETQELTLLIQATDEMTAPTEIIEEEMEEEESSGIEVDEGFFNVTITLPAVFFEDDEDFDPEIYKEEQGFKDATVNDDGSVTVVMSKRQHDEILFEMKSDINESFQELIEAEDTPYIISITSTEGYETVFMDVDRAGYESTWDFTPLIIGISALMYQQVDGTELHCEVIVRDVETGEILSSVVYPDAFSDSD